MKFVIKGDNARPEDTVEPSLSDRLSNRVVVDGRVNNDEVSQVLFSLRKEGYIYRLTGSVGAYKHFHRNIKTEIAFDVESIAYEAEE